MALSMMASNTGVTSVVEPLITRSTPLMAVWYSSASLSSAVRSSTLRSSPAYEACSSEPILLNCSARPSSSSPVLIWMRWSSSPAPMRAAPSCSARIGRTSARASTKLSAAASSRPPTSSHTSRMIDSRSGASASARGDSTNTVQFNAGMRAWAANTGWPARSRASTAAPVSGCASAAT